MFTFHEKVAVLSTYRQLGSKLLVKRQYPGPCKS